MAIYLRISKSDVRSTSIEKQRANCLAYVERTWPGAEVVEYVDDGKSASKRTHARTEYQRLRLDLPKLFAVVVDTQDRISRKPLDFWTFAAEAEDSATIVRGASEPLELDSVDGELTAGVRLAVARAEARRTAKRVLATNQYLASQGKRPLGGKIPWGFVRTPEHTVRPVPDKAPVLVSAVRRIIVGDLTIRGWANEMTQTHPTVAGAKMWSHRTCAQLLRNPTLAGMIPAGDDVLRGTDGMPIVDPDAAIIDMDTWDALQAILVKRAVPTQRRSAGLPLLQGLAHDIPGHRLHAHRLSTRPDRYACRLTVCDMRATIVMSHLNGHVVDAVMGVIGDFEELVSRVVEPGRDTQKLLAVRAQIDGTMTALRDERDPVKIADLASRLVSLRATEAETEAVAVESRTEMVPTGRTIREAFTQAPDDDAKREIIAGPVERVIIAPGRPGGGRQEPIESRVSIVWRGGDGVTDPDF